MPPTASRTPFAITDGIPSVGDRTFPWASAVNDNLTIPDWPWIGFELRLETGWTVHAMWRRGPAVPGEPDGTTANVNVVHGDIAAARTGNPTITCGIPTHQLAAKNLASPDWFHAALDLATRVGPGPDHDLRRPDTPDDRSVLQAG